VIQRAERKFPWISGVVVRECRAASTEHRKSWRQFAHAGHVKGAVCVAREAEDALTDLELVGMCAHELGHVVGDRLRFPAHSRPWRGEKTPKRVQDEADKISELYFGIPIRYNRRRIQVPATLAALK